MAQVPPPPQAEGRNIFWLPRVDSRLDPAGAMMGLLSSPLIMIFTSPEFTSLDWANNRISTSSTMIRVNATMDVIITEPMKFWFYFFFGIRPFFGCTNIFINQ
jgi:hypothetical protein